MKAGLSKSSSLGPTGMRLTLTATLCHGWQRRPARLLAQLGRRTGPRSSTPALESFVQKRTLSRLSVISTLKWQNLAQADYLIPRPWKRPDLALQVAQDPHDLPRVGLSYPSHWQEERSSFGGFLYYYHEPTRMPPLAGELRFRITPTPDPASFRDGSDLRTEGRYGFIWGIPLATVARSQKFWPIQRLLTVGDGIVSRDVVDLAENCQAPNICPRTARDSRYLHEFGQPFSLPLNQTCHSFSFIGERHVAVAPIQKLVGFLEHKTLRLPLLGEHCSMYAFQMLHAILTCHTRHHNMLLRTVFAAGPCRKACLGDTSATPP